MVTGSKKYSNGEITVLWTPSKCIHAARCVTGLPSVFNASHRPWVNINGATTEEITKTIDKCPSGALSYTYDKK